MVIPAKAGIQNPYHISPFANGETKRGRAIYRQLTPNDGQTIQRISGTLH
jgi:hypothetical protein